MDRLGTVDRDADEPVVLFEELAPAGVEQNAVGLHRVRNRLSAAVALLQLDELLVKCRTRERGLATLKGERAVGVGVEEPGIHQPLERFGSHAAAGQSAVGIGFAVQIEAVRAVEIANGGGRFDEQRGNARRCAFAAGNQRREDRKLDRHGRQSSIARRRVC